MPQTNALARFKTWHLTWPPVIAPGADQQQFGHAFISSTLLHIPYVGDERSAGSEAAGAVPMAKYRGEQMRRELSEKETWEWIAAQIREHGLPKRGHPKKEPVDRAFDRLADALLKRTEHAIAKLKLNDRQRRNLIRVLRSRLRSMVTPADRRSSPRKS